MSVNFSIVQMFVNFSIIIKNSGIFLTIFFLSDSLFYLIICEGFFV